MKRFFILTFLILFSPVAHGASMEISLRKDAEDTVRATLFMDTDVSVNTFEISVDFDENLLQFSGYSTQEAISGVWIDEPKDIGGVIRLSQIIPGGVDGLYNPDTGVAEKIPLVDLFFIPTSEGEASFKIINSSMLQNDGYGTLTPHDRINASLSISREMITKIKDTTKETTPPTNLSITLIKSSIFSKTPQMIAFQAEDYESGIAKYEIKRGFGDWKEAKSPYPIRSGIFDKDLYVRAYDFAGNYSEASIVIKSSIYLKAIFYTLIVILALFWVRKLVK